jgi:ketosteroid isomerase-like protein
MSSNETEQRLLAIEARLQVAEDIEAIKQLQYRYMNAFMTAKWDEIVSLFADDARIDVTADKQLQGKEAVEKIYKEELAVGHIGREGDFVLHPLISINGNKATGNWLMYMMYCYRITGQPLYWIQGVYDAEYVKVKGQWKFSYLHHRPRLGGPHPEPPPSGPRPPVPGT